MSAQELIREAQPADAAMLADVGRRTAEHWFQKVYSPQELQAFLQRDFTEDVLSEQIANAERHTFFIHEVGHKAVGFARLNWDKPVPLTKESGAELQKIYYLPACTGRGLGHRLLNVIVEAVALRGEKILWLDVLDNNPRARAFYEQYGFETVGPAAFVTDLGNIGMHVLMLRVRAHGQRA